MLNSTQLTNGKYVCCWCENIYDLEDAWRAKGSKFFCSMKCVLNYAELNDNNYERLREGE